MNPLYSMLMGGQPQAQQPSYQPWQQPQQQMSGAPMFMNPIQKANYIMQAMTNPAAFVRQALPDLPPQIANDPNQILQWMQQTKGVTPQQIQDAMSQMPRF